MILTDLRKRKEEKYSNIISNAVMEKEADKALEFAARVFTNTFGPYAYHTILEDQQLHHTITKDGFSVYKNVVVYGRIGRAILSFVKKVSGTVNEVVGDGTTSAVIIGNELKRLKRLIKRYRVSPKTVSVLLKRITGLILENIDDIFVRKIDVENLSKDQFKAIISRLASVSLNNDIEKGNLVADIFSRLDDPANGFINVEISKSAETSCDPDRGFEIFRGMIMDEFVTEPDERTAIHKNPRILLIEGDIANNDIEGLNHIINICTGKWGRPLVIIAGGYSSNIREILRQSMIRHAEKTGKMFPMLAVEIDTLSVLGKEEVLDIEAAIGATAIKTENGKNLDIYPEVYLDKVMGECERVKSTKFRTSIIRGKADEAKVNFRMDKIDSIIEQMKSEHHIDHRNDIVKQLKRKACLRSDMFTLYVGGQSLEEKEASAALFDDAVRGCKSAVQYGVLPGCHITIPHYIRKYLLTNLDEVYKHCESYVSEPPKKVRKLIKAILKDIAISYENTYCKILQNKFSSRLKCKMIAKKSIMMRRVYNLLKDEYEATARELLPASINDYPSIINSADMDKHILKAATSIIDLLITSNQFARVPSREEMIKNL